jgi:hypothetical protein
MAQNLFVHLFHEVVHSRSIDRHASKRLICSTWGDNGCVRESFGFGDEVDLTNLDPPFHDINTHHIHSEPITSLLQPPMHHIVYCFSDFWILPVEVGLFFQERVEVVFAGAIIPFPGRPADPSACESRSDAHPPKVEFQLFGGTLSPLSFCLAGCQIYQSLLGSVFELFDSLNQAC